MSDNRRPAFSVLSALVATTLLVSCTSTQTSGPNAQKGSIRKNDAVAKIIEAHDPPPVKERDADAPRTVRDIENLSIGEVIQLEEPNTATLYDNSRYDFPITVNSRVEGWIDYFTGRGRPHMERYLGRSSRYIPVMKQVFKNAGLPEDLVFLALIESGFNLRAKSHARAVGPWQFIKGTGKRYGLRVDAWVDERRDPIRSTEAAASYLKDLYLMFESWYLAASAYNAGEYKILRAIEQLKTNNYWRICDTRMLRRETKDYVPKLIAAAIIGKNPAKYGFQDVAYMEPLEYETVQVNFPVQLSQIAKVVDTSEDEILDLNPHLARHMVPQHLVPYTVRIPTGSRTLVESALGNMKRNITQVDMPLQHTVRAGETLRTISNRYRVAVRTLANANNLGPREKLTPGDKLVIPGKKDSLASLEKATVAKAKRTINNDPPSKDGYTNYTVRRGDSLWSISEEHNVTVQQIFKWNSLKKNQIFPGMKLKIKATDSASPGAGMLKHGNPKKS